MNIVFICNEIPPASYGGIGTCVLSTAKGLSALGHQVKIVGIYKKDYKWNIPGVKVIPIIKFAPRGLVRVIPKVYLYRIAIYKKLLEINKDFHIDIIEWPDAGGLFLKPLKGVSDVVRNHGPLMSHRIYGLSEKNRLIEKYELFTLQNIDNWIGVSNWFMDEWLKISGANPTHKTVIYNPVDFEIFNNHSVLHNNDKWILFAGSIMERKGVFQLIEASNLFLKQHKDVKLLIAGRDYWGGIEKIENTIKPKFRNNILLLHPLSQKSLALLMKQSLIFAMPSYLESFGNVWAEAMACGLPIIGSKLTCGPEIVPNNRAGVLVDPNDINEISESICSLLENSEMRATMGKEGNKFAREYYSSEISVKHTENFYKEIV